MAYIAKVQKFSNAISVYIPGALRDALELRKGDYVILALAGNGIIAFRKLTDKEVLWNTGEIKEVTIQYASANGVTKN